MIERSKRRIRLDSVRAPEGELLFGIEDRGALPEPVPRAFDLRVVVGARDRGGGLGGSGSGLLRLIVITQHANRVDGTTERERHFCRRDAFSLGSTEEKSKRAIVTVRQSADADAR